MANTFDGGLAEIKDGKTDILSDSIHGLWHFHHIDGRDLNGLSKASAWRRIMPRSVE